MRIGLWGLEIEKGVAENFLFFLRRYSLIFSLAEEVYEFRAFTILQPYTDCSEH